MAASFVDPKLDEFIKFLESLSEIPLSPWQKELAKVVLSGKKFRIVQGRKGSYIVTDA